MDPSERTVRALTPSRGATGTHRSSNGNRGSHAVPATSPYRAAAIVFAVVLALLTALAVGGHPAVSAAGPSGSSPVTAVQQIPVAQTVPAVQQVAVAPQVPAGFVHVCGMSLCINSSPFQIRGATAYGTYSDPTTEVNLAVKAHLNTLAVVEFETHYHSLADTMSAATWTRVDQFIATARAAHLHIVLTLSSYAQSLQQAGITPTRTDWEKYLSFIANRTNTVTHVQYKNDPTIALVQLWGEACYPGEADHTCPAGTSGTATDMRNFYYRSIREWQALAPKILISTGGFSHLNPTNASGIPWQAIMSDPANPLCEFEVNSPNDVKGTVDKVTSYCRQLHKPWYLAAWSSCYADTGYPFYTPSDSSMAAHARAMYSLQHGVAPAVIPAVGSEFWNLRDRGVQPGHCDIGPSFPQTFGVIQNGG